MINIKRVAFYLNLILTGIYLILLIWLYSFSDGELGASYVTYNLFVTFIFSLLILFAAYKHLKIEVQNIYISFILIIVGLMTLTYLILQL